MIGRGMAKRCLEPIWRNGKDPKSAALDEDAEGPAKMFRMGQRLKLARTGGNPLFERRVADAHAFDNAGQKPALRHEFVRPQALRFACIADGAEVHVGGDVLFTGLREQVASQMMTKVRAQGAVLSFRRNKFLRRQPIIKRDQSSNL